jgi:hypothetical protein
MNDETKRPFKESLWLAIAPSVLTLIGVFIGLGVQWYFFFAKTEADQKTANDEAKQRQIKIDAELKNANDASDKRRAKEFRLKYYERQLTFFTELCDVTSRIALANKLTDVRSDTSRFYTLALGNVTVMADPTLDKHVTDFWNTLCVLPLNQMIPNDKRMRLQVLSMDIAKACRDSLEHTFALDKRDYGNWNVGALPPPKD